MSATVYNCTPHDIHVYDTNGKTILHTFPRNLDWTLRVITKEQKDLGTFQGVPLVSRQDPNGFSDEQTALIEQAHRDQSVLLTSGYAAEVILEKWPDFAGQVFGPDSGPSSAVRNDRGQIIGVRRFEVHK